MKNKRVGKRAKASKDENFDIVDLIKDDHKPLKELIKILKDPDEDFDERKMAFKEFAPLLTAHAKAEERVLYENMKENKDLREEAFEGEIEHNLAELMVEQSRRTRDEDVWTAKAKVLAELVEHHIEEEEDELLPKFKKSSEKEERSRLGEEYLYLKEKIESGGDDRDSQSQSERRSPYQQSTHR